MLLQITLVVKGQGDPPPKKTKNGHIFHLDKCLAYNRFGVLVEEYCPKMSILNRKSS